MKILRITHIIVFLFFVNVLLAQVGLQVEKVESNFSESFNFKTSNTSSLFLNKKNEPVLPQDLRNHFLSDKSIINPQGSFSQNNTMKRDLAFFCRIEVELEKSTKLPVRFRLGEVQAVDKKEGKWSQFQQ